MICDDCDCDPDTCNHEPEDCEYDAQLSDAEDRFEAERERRKEREEEWPTACNASVIFI